MAPNQSVGAGGTFVQLISVVGWTLVLPAGSHSLDLESLGAIRARWRELPEEQGVTEALAVDIAQERRIWVAVRPPRTRSSRKRFVAGGCCVIIGVGGSIVQVNAETGMASALGLPDWSTASTWKV